MLEGSRNKDFSFKTQKKAAENKWDKAVHVMLAVRPDSLTLDAQDLQKAEANPQKPSSDLHMCPYGT